ncbi:hypothetical protein K8I85_07185 [bacterium]|nr:hypothetical protein [bacterium]
MPRSRFRPLVLLPAGLLLASAALAVPATAQTLTLSPEELLAASTSWSINQRPRVLFTEDGAKHIAWVAGASFGAEDVLLVSAPSAAAAYGSPLQLSAAMDGVRTGIADGLEIDARGTNMLASWEGTPFDNRPMWFARSTDSGATWEAALRADPDTVKERAYTTGTLFDDGRVAQIWITYDDVTGEPSHEWRAQDGGGVFSAPSNPCAASPDVPCECCTADPIVLDDGTVLVAYRNNEANRRRMYVSRSTDGGATFPSSVRVDQGGSLFFACPGSPPSITADGADVLVVWGKVGGAPQTFHTMSARSTDGGVTWALQVQVDDSDGTTAAGYPTVSRRGNLAVAAWGAKDPLSNQFEAYCATSTNGGTTWGPEQALTGDGLSGAVRHAGVAISPSGDVEFVWFDQRDGTEKIYRRSGSLGATGAPAPGAGAAAAYGAPNPFRGGTTIRFAQPPASARAILTITDVRGRTVVRLPGASVFRWDGRDADGRPAPAGVYFARRDGAESAVRIVRIR